VNGAGQLSELDAALFQRQTANPFLDLKTGSRVSSRHKPTDESFSSQMNMHARRSSLLRHPSRNHQEHGVYAASTFASTGAFRTKMTPADDSGLKRPEGLIFLHISHGSVPGVRCAYQTLWSAVASEARHRFVVNPVRGVPSEPAIPARPKAPSPLRSAGALHRLQPLSTHTRHLLVRVAYKDEA
jgi:hypothetical protein